jgi:hypothetical protein
VSQVAIFYPVFVQVLLTVVVYVLLQRPRPCIGAASRKHGSGDIAMGRFAWPDDAQKRAHNQRNQFELPVLFMRRRPRPILGAVDLTTLALRLDEPRRSCRHPHRAEQDLLAGPAFVPALIVTRCGWSSARGHACHLTSMRTGAQIKAAIEVLTRSPTGTAGRQRACRLGRAIACRPGDRRHRQPGLRRLAPAPVAGAQMESDARARSLSPPPRGRWASPPTR